ncbi:MAG: hypothetical protein C0609_02240 [Deltaproteobacteria bacterium]|nr:MAG: hypothetical protein C0609_02240 [Deltaproteobacteria bacterium]
MSKKVFIAIPILLALLVWGAYKLLHEEPDPMLIVEEITAGLYSALHEEDWPRAAALFVAPPGEAALARAAAELPDIHYPISVVEANPVGDLKRHNVYTAIGFTYERRPVVIVSTIFQGEDDKWRIERWIPSGAFMSPAAPAIIAARVLNGEFMADEEGRDLSVLYAEFDGMEKIKGYFVLALSEGTPTIDKYSFELNKSGDEWEATETVKMGGQ